MSEDKSSYLPEFTASEKLYEALAAVRDKGYGEVTAIIRNGKIIRIVKTEETKLE